MGECVGVCAVSGGGWGAELYFKRITLLKKVTYTHLKKNVVVQRIFHYPEKSYYPDIQEDHFRFLFIHICR